MEPYSGYAGGSFLFNIERGYKMLKLTRTYTDYNGVERTENFYFNLSKAEIAEMELSTSGGFAEYMQRIVDAKDAPAIIKAFKEVILKAYGEKSDDGKYFRKSAELSEAFSQTEAYSDLFMDLATNAEEASKFINGILPADSLAAANKTMTLTAK